MRQFFSSLKFKIIVSVFAALLLGIFIAAVSGGSSPLSSALGVVMTPLNSLSRMLSDKAASFRAEFRSASYYEQEANALREEIASYREQLVDYEKLQHKLNAYEAFLEVKGEHPDYTFMPAAVILRDAADVGRGFTVNKGSLDGVAVNDPVIYGKNLVGVVREVGEKTAFVASILTPGVSVSAYEIRTREDCYTEARTDLALEGRLRISGLSRSTPIVSGGVLCTSGIGGLYPRDLIIGTVTEIVNSEEDVSAYGIVTPDVDPLQITDVFVITDFDGKVTE